MAPERPSSPHRVSKPAIVLFGLCAVVVGAVGSAQAWNAHLGGTIPLGRLLPVVVVAEILAYCTVMLAQLGVQVTGLAVLLGVATGLVMRVLEALVAAIAGSPTPEASFGQAFGHYYGSFWVGCVLQVVVTTLFLWLVRGAFELPKPVLVAPQSDVPDMEPERMRGFHRDSERRRELIEALMRHEGEGEGEVVQEAPMAAEPEPPLELAVELEPEAEVAPEPEPEPVLELKLEPEAAAEPEVAAEIEPVTPTEPEPEAGPEPETEPEPVRAGLFVREPEGLTSAESVLLALREDDDEFAPAAPVVEVPVAPPEPVEADPPAVAPAPEVALSAAQVMTGEAVTATAALGSVAAAVGAGALGVTRAASGRLVALAVGGDPATEEAVARVEACAVAGDALAAAAGIGQGGRLLLRLAAEAGYLGGTLPEGIRGGLVALVQLPRGANFGVASQALAKLEAAADSLEVPACGHPERADYPPAYVDRDLEQRVAPLLEWVPEAAGSSALCASAGGRQVVLLARGEQPGAEAAAAVAHAFAAAEMLCVALGHAGCDMGLWCGAQGSVAACEADVAGQRVLVGLVQHGAGAVPANVQLQQIIGALGRLTGSANGGNASQE